MTQMYSRTTHSSFSFALTPWVKRLLIANVAIFFVTWVDQRFFFDWFAFSPSTVLTRPWGVVTYMFLHGNFMHLFVNMLVLFFFGPPLERQWGSGEFIRFYLICGLGGVALSFLFQSASIVGASAAIYGLMLAFAMNWPEAPIYIWGIFPVKAKWLVGFFFLVSLMGAFGGEGGNIAHFAHLGGIITGFLYLRSDWRPGRKQKIRRSTKQVRRMVVVPRRDVGRSESAGRAAGGGGGTQEKAVLDEVDRILDKISAEGMGSLTNEEKKTLDQVSRRRRTN